MPSNPVLQREQGKAFWQDRLWWRKNWWTAVVAFIAITGYITATTVQFSTVTSQGKDIDTTRLMVDTLVKKHMIINQSFTSYRMSVEEDLEDINESISEIQEEQSEAHDLLIGIAYELGVE